MSTQQNTKNSCINEIYCKMICNLCGENEKHIFI